MPPFIAHLSDNSDNKINKDTETSDTINYSWYVMFSFR